MRWSAVFAGGALAIGLWVLLQSIAIGIALVSAEPGDVHALGIGNSWWTLLAPLVAMFAGGIVAGRLAATRESRMGMIHGGVMWAFATLAGIFASIALVAASTQALTRDASRLPAETAVIDPERALAMVDIDDSMLAPVNHVLVSRGKRPMTAPQLAGPVHMLAIRAIHDGRLDREALLVALIERTGLDRRDVEEVSARLAARYDAALARARVQMGDVNRNTQQIALAARTGRALLWTGAGLVLGLGVALAGGALGARRTRDLDERNRTAATTVVVPPVTPIDMP